MFEEMSYTEIAAWWGAILSSIVFLWNLYKWKVKAARLLMWLEPNTRAFGDPAGEAKSWISVTVSNIGERPTLLQSLGIRYYAGWLQRLRNQPEISVAFPNPSQNFPLPRLLKPDDHWAGMIPQDTQDTVENHPSLEELSRTGHVMICLAYSNKRKEIRRRLVIPTVLKK